MNVSEIFVKRPVMTTLVMVGVLVFGIVGYRNLPVAALPNVDFPTISVSASLPGASPDFPEISTWPSPTSSAPENWRRALKSFLNWRAPSTLPGTGAARARRGWQ